MVCDRQATRMTDIDIKAPKITDVISMSSIMTDVKVNATRIADVISMSTNMIHVN